MFESKLNRQKQSRHGAAMRLLLAVGLSACQGCATMRGPGPSWTINDPPALSPQNQPLITRRPEQPALPELPDTITQRALESELAPPTLPESSVDRPVEPAPSLTGPMLVPARPKAALDFQVLAPPKMQVGSGARFVLTLQNQGATTLKNVTLRCDFGKPWTLPGVTEPAAVQDLGNIPAGEFAETTLTLFSSELGKQCCDFSVSCDGEESFWKSVCVEYVEPELTLELVGPKERDLGSRAEFIVSVANTSQEDRDDVQVLLSFPLELKPREVTDNPSEEPGRLVWNVGKLRAGEGVRLQAQFECVTEIEQACLIADIRGGDLPWESAKTCLAVTKPVGVMQMRLQDQADPVDVGDETAYTIYLDHRGLQAIRNVRVQLELPSAFRLISVESKEDETALDLKHRLEDGKIILDPLLIVRPGTHHRFHFRVKAIEEGEVEARAALRSGVSDEPVVIVEPTLIRPDPLRRRLEAPPP